VFFEGLRRSSDPPESKALRVNDTGIDMVRAALLKCRYERESVFTKSVWREPKESKVNIMSKLRIYQDLLFGTHQ